MAVEVVTIGETMVAFIPHEHTYLRYAQQFGKVIAGAESNVAVGLAKLYFFCPILSFAFLIH